MTHFSLSHGAKLPLQIHQAGHSGLEASESRWHPYLRSFLHKDATPCRHIFDRVLLIGGSMVFRELLEDVCSLSYIANQRDAEDSIKAVLGLLTNQMEKDQAQLFTSELPEPLTFSRLYGQLSQPEHLTEDQFIEELMSQLSLPHDQALELSHRIIGRVMSDLSPSLKMTLSQQLPPELASPAPPQSYIRERPHSSRV